MKGIKSFFGILKGSFTGSFNLIGGFFKKFGVRISITMILVITLLSTSIFASISQGSFVPFIEGVGKRIVLSDNQLEEKTKELLESPEESLMFKELKPTDETVNLFTRISNYISNIGIKINNFFSKISIFYNLFTNLWFLYMLGYVLYIFFLYTILQDNSKVTGGIMLAFIFLITIQIVFSVVTYDDSTPWSQLSNDQKIEKVKPFRGTLYMLSNINEISQTVFKKDISHINLNTNSSSINNQNVVI